MMRTVAKRWSVFAVLLAACGGGGVSKSGGGGGGDGAGGSRCDLAAINLGDARRVSWWQPPCRPSTPIDARIQSEEEFRALFRCGRDVPSGIDFTRDQLIVESRDLSPAGGAGEIVDDGSTVTRVGYFRSPCLGDPLPTPITIQVEYLLPAGEERQFADASCTIREVCR
jgi:hypothetical protein